MKIKLIFAAVFLIFASYMVIWTASQMNRIEEVSILPNSSASLLSPDRIVNIAHRGASGHAPEHTIEAYEMGERMGADYIEIDLQMTKDGQLVAMHDPEVNRTTNEIGLVSEYTLNDMKELDAGSWFNQAYPDKAQESFERLTIPTLHEVFERFGADANYYIEIKQSNESPGMTDSLIHTLKEYELIPTEREGAVIIQSFSKESLQEIHEIEPDLPIIQLISFNQPAEISSQELTEIKKYAVGLGVNYRYINESFVKDVREAGLLLHTYTVNEQKDMRQLLGWGVTGIFTNYPDRLSEVLGTAL
ncbi:glycerophosphodiester phosphodiesterase [Gracilibacillus xinjiangensis]|uniref:Glycerophosphodiester phosphodiesterase n=1 Tax=Gracilibacillus xinjiangensis TaxID=1193282 RepID=A0ABV8WUD9_9BACI